MGVSNSNNRKSNKEINLIYNINNNEKISLFGSDFVHNNKNICKMIIDNKEYEIVAEYKVKNYKNNILKIKLKGINNITNMSYMFDKCSSLISLPDISNWNTNNVKNMSYMFYECSSLISLPDISNWKTNNVKDMHCMFDECSS